MGKVRGGCTGSSDLWRPGLLSFPSALDPRDGSMGTKEGEQVRGVGRTNGDLVFNGGRVSVQEGENSGR